MGSQGNLVGSVFLILLPSGAVNIWKGRVSLGGCVPQLLQGGQGVLADS